jgi:succinate-semialdehyde dehydrogenase/glutarate-semialdehyde dehydrogenase
MLATRCMSTVKRVSLELGRNAPFIIFDDADVEAAAAGVIASKSCNAGQTCVCANRILVHAPVYGQFAKFLAAKICALQSGNGLSASTDLGPLINRAAVRKVKYGIVGLNTGMISTVVAPFGDVKESGFGREGSHYRMDEFLDYKLVFSDVGAGI